VTDDFERIWQGRLTGRLDASLGEDARRRILVGGQRLSDESPRREVLVWTGEMLGRLESLAGSERAQQLLAVCTCQYPQAGLADIRACYAETGDVATAHRMLQARFEQFLRQELSLEPSVVTRILERGWGLAGTLRGDQIIATKMPKSGSVRAYFEESDPRRRRALYCHCPRVRQAPVLGATLPRAYCSCGAGFYQGIWEHILSQPVRVEVLSSVLSGDDQCSIAIDLPASTRGTGGPCHTPSD
jgi:hypothetical protein